MFFASSVLSVGRVQFSFQPLCRLLIVVAWASPARADDQREDGDGGRAEVLAHTSGGDLRGVVEAGGAVDSFKGIPYAEPPVGELRWRSPRPAKAWSGVRDASRFGRSAMQATRSTYLPDGPWTEEFLVQNEVGEDCLYLNVWAPRARSAAGRPVLVYFHGGGLVEGSGSVAVYDGTNLAAAGVVAVTINYRLGVFGFLSHPELSAESEHHASGNYGILDCVEALTWVRQNIAAFGGDPARVTIAGQSAGAWIVHVLTVSPLAKGLFARAVAFSGSSLARFDPNTRLPEAERQGQAFAQAAGGGDIADLRKLSAAELFARLPDRKTMRFGVVVDGFVLPDAISARLARGEQNDVPVLTGLTADDVGSPPRRVTRDWLVGQAESLFPGKVGRFLALYPTENDEVASRVAKVFTRDLGRAETFQWATSWAQAAASPVYTYYFDRAIPWPEHPEFGAFHTGDIPYFFRNLPVLQRPWTDADHEIAQIASSYWLNFIRSGDPNGDGLTRRGRKPCS